ncbi:hypothetical protein [Rhizohabitans arisaemae]|uniref:hypothetical protein n=1 Tax=Rhizohabitans arisaemae TaxID=2720610 RepID=UPI0024B22F2A|nr:hypothetical protein [Rhizohabitans arisaemae]
MDPSPPALDETSGWANLVATEQGNAMTRLRSDPTRSPLAGPSPEPLVAGQPPPAVPAIPAGHPGTP